MGRWGKGIVIPAGLPYAGLGLKPELMIWNFNTLVQSVSEWLGIFVAEIV